MTNPHAPTLSKGYFMSLREIALPVRKFLPKTVTADSRNNSKRPIHIPCSNVSYLPSEKKFFPNETVIENRSKFWNGKSFYVQMCLYMSKNPHLEFLMFHKYGDDKPCVIFFDTQAKVKVAVSVNDFKSYKSIPKIDIPIESKPKDLSQICCPVPKTKKEIYEILTNLRSH
jgi:hypothetical protein